MIDVPAGCVEKTSLNANGNAEEYPNALYHCFQPADYTSENKVLLCYCFLCTLYIFITIHLLPNS